jgi:hypothetical protein
MQKVLILFLGLSQKNVHLVTISLYILLEYSRTVRIVQTNSWFATLRNFEAMPVHCPIQYLYEF